MEIVEKEGTGKPGLIFSNPTGVDGGLNIGGVGCKHRACPNMEGSTLAEVKPENSQEAANKIKFTNLLTNYVNQKKEKKVANFTLAGKAAKLTGELEIELITPEIELFGPNVK